MPWELDRIREATEALQPHLPSEFHPDFALVLGSGLGPVSEAIEVSTDVPYAEIPHWPEGDVAGHPGRLLTGKLGGANVLVLAGRVHLYERFSAPEAAFGIRVAHQVGVKRVVLTNAAGCLHPDWAPGHLALIADHINLQGGSPLAGDWDEELGGRFVDLTEVYDAALRDMAREAARAQDIPLHEGIYAAVLGPNFETPAEIRFLRTIGADLVGMSTVPEAIAARQMGMSVLGVSMIANAAAGMGAGPVSHEEVLAAGAEAAPRLVELLAGFGERVASLPKPS